MIWLVRRLTLSLSTLFLTSILVFSATIILPGDVATAILGRQATPEALAHLRTQLKLERPAVERYIIWIRGVLHGDLGMSLARGRPVLDLVRGRFGNTLVLAGCAGLLGIPLALLLGIIAGVYRDGFLDHLISGVALVGMSLPEFVIAPVLIFLFALSWPLFPAVTVVSAGATVRQLLPNVVLPSLTLALVMVAYVVRMVRTGVIEAMASEHVQMALLRGLPRSRVVWRHAMPGALLPTLSAVALTIAWLVGGVVVVETVFNYPGLGRLMVSAVADRDVPVILALGQLGALTNVGVQLFTDVLSFALDPRIRDARGFA